MAKIEVKALIDKEKNEVLFVECNGDFVDVLFSFLTMPMGTIIKLTKNQPSSTTIGSMNNLYKNVELLDLKYFRTKQCKAMLLSPKSTADARIKNIRVAIGNDEAYDYFLCQKSDCSYSVASHYKDAYCYCGKIMDQKWILSPRKLEDKEGGVFVKGLTRYIVSDELQIAPLSSAATFSLLSERGVKNGSCEEVEEKNFSIGKKEVLTLLKSLLVSKAPLTEILLNNSETKRPKQECLGDITVKKRAINSSLGGNISVKLIVNKSNETVVYAEANEDFIDLLFSFLTIPLGNVAKSIQGSCSEGCAQKLYQSVSSLDATENLISSEVKQSLVSPTIPRHFGIRKQLLGFKESSEYSVGHKKGNRIRYVTCLDPKSRDNKSGRYVKEHTKFTVTDDLVIKPISPLSGLSILKESNIPFSDVEERIVHVGKEEATRLLVASLISESPLTDVFISHVPNQEYNDSAFCFDFVNILLGKYPVMTK